MCETNRNISCFIPTTSQTVVVQPESVSYCYSGFPKETPELKFGLRFFFFLFVFFVQPQFAIKSLIRMRDDLTLMCAWHGIMADEERFMRWKISTNTVKNTLKTDTKYSHSVRGRPTLKVEERCRDGLVRKPYERSL